MAPDATFLEVSMGTLMFSSSEIPVAGEVRDVLREKLSIGGATYEINCASIGNPHCVVILDTISKPLALELGPQLETHRLFPNKTNVQLVKVIDRGNIEMEIWERGAGYTLASGSSSCAAAGVCHKLGLCDDRVEVHMPGGTITVSIGEDFGITMAGPVSSVVEGTFTEEFIHAILEKRSHGES
jgi:diaminopimelate epimerase